MDKNLDYSDEVLLLTNGFKYGLTFSTMWKTGTDGKKYCCTLPEMHWHVLQETGKGLSLPATPSRLMKRSMFKDLFELKDELND